MNRLTGLVASLLRLPSDAVTRGLAMKDTETWDSLRHMELVVALEETFGVTLSGDEIAAMTSVGAIEDTLRAKGVDP